MGTRMKLQMNEMERRDRYDGGKGLKSHGYPNAKTGTDHGRLNRELQPRQYQQRIRLLLSSPFHTSISQPFPSQRKHPLISTSRRHPLLHLPTTAPPATSRKPTSQNTLNVLSDAQTTLHCSRECPKQDWKPHKLFCPSPNCAPPSTRPHQSWSQPNLQPRSLQRRPSTQASRKQCFRATH